jgi:sulfite reductase (ferredoxin)
MNFKFSRGEKSVVVPVIRNRYHRFDVAIPATLLEVPKVTIEDTAAYEAWKQSNVIVQKQAGYLAIGIKVLRRFYTDKARANELIKLRQ